MSVRGAARVIRVVVAEDSPVTLEYLVALLADDPAISVVAKVRDGQEAVDAVEHLRPDVVLMDIHMPRLNGLEATRRIMSRVPTPIVLVSASLRPDESELSFEAMKAGALTVLDKPPAPGQPGQVAAARELVVTLKLMADVKVVRRTRREDRAPSQARQVQAGRRIGLIAIGASTGGPAAIAEILEGMDGTRTPPVLVVQHMTPGFTPGFVEWLGHQIRLRVKQAEDGEVANPGVVYVAPDGNQLGIGPDARLRLEPASASHEGQPTVAHLFDSVARAYGRDVLAILLTGMGRDGAAELGRLRRLGADTVAQDEASSVVFGMPAEAARIGAARHVLSLEEIARMIRSLSAWPNGIG